MVAVNGWAEQSQTPVVELGKRFEDEGVSAIIYTDIERDGAMSGVNLEATAAFANSLSIPIIACGGMKSITCFEDAVKKGGADAVDMSDCIHFNRIQNVFILTEFEMSSF